ncbi:hypothetical protein INS49_005673 [Diaporthe citri]|uniref:uncharacterized protein n=1 Tax=Diaporthe citri TaxID=83186 RepID=UPI001C80BD2B|nr:uncharacterized protein INS49_005673 [Diaporthe citri]KAG6353492.1 hypothetical protein INS49_005673 [Diaporthe citri]
MAIRETWHRMVRKSFSSSSSTARSDDGDDTPQQQQAHQQASRRRPANGSSGSNGAKEGGSGDSSSRKASPKRDSPPKSILKKSGGNGGGFGGGFQRRLHPSERPLTEQNLRHQEMLGTFTMKFGRSRRFSRGARSSFSGISPRCSVDSSAGPGAAGWGVDDNDGADGGGAPGYHGRVSSAAVAPDEARIAEESS